jgi:hypothetical protein
MYGLMAYMDDRMGFDGSALMIAVQRERAL